MPCLPGATAVLAGSRVIQFMLISEVSVRAAIDGFVDPYLQQTLAGKILSYQMEKRYFDKNRQIVFVRLSVSLIRDPDGEPFYFVSQIENITELKDREVERENLIAELRESLARVKTLSGLIPICGWCKNVRADKGYWQTVEQYVLSQTEATFSHGICPDCQEKLKADIARVNAKP